MVIIDALDILCAQLTRDLFATAKFLLWFKLHVKFQKVIYASFLNFLKVLVVYNERYKYKFVILCLFQKSKLTKYL